MQIRGLYKCRLCSKIVHDDKENLNSGDIDTMLMTPLFMPRCLNPSKFEKYVTHDCDESKTGVCDLVGCEKFES